MKTGQLKTHHEFGFDHDALGALDRIVNSIQGFTNFMPKVTELGETASQVMQQGFNAIWYILPLEILLLSYALANLKNSVKVAAAATLMAVVGAVAPV